MTPNEIYALDDLDEKPWYAFINSSDILSECFPVLRDLSVDFDRAKADGNNRFSLCLKIRTPTGRSKDYTCWALMFDGRPFGVFTAQEHLSEHSLDANVDVGYPHVVYITDLTLWQTAEDLVCFYVSKPISNKPIFDLPVVASDQTLVFQPHALASVIVDSMALMVPTYHRIQDGIVAFNALVYHKLLNELIKREGEEKLNQMKWTSRSSIVKEIAHIGLLSVPKGIEARVGVGIIESLYYGWRRALAILRLDSGTYGLTIQKGACLRHYQNSYNIRPVRLGGPDMFGSAHERMKWIEEDHRRAAPRSTLMVY